MAAADILTNEVLFGVVRDRHCSADSQNRIAIKENNDFKFAIKETIEFLFSCPGQPLLLDQKTWTDKRAKYLCTKFSRKWKKVCIDFHYYLFTLLESFGSNFLKLELFS